MRDLKQVKKSLYYLKVVCLLGICFLFAENIQAQANGRNATVVSYAAKEGEKAGEFVKMIDDNWAEFKAGNKAIHGTFQEVSRDAWTVTLRKSDGLIIAMNLHTKKVNINGKPHYTIEKSVANREGMKLLGTSTNAQTNWFYIESLAKKGKVINVAGDGNARSTNIVVLDRGRNQKNQQFRLVQSSAGSPHYKIISKLKSDKVLDDSSVKGTVGANVVLHKEHGGENQRFQVLVYENTLFFRSTLQLSGPLMRETKTYLGIGKNGNLEMVPFSKSAQFKLKRANSGNSAEDDLFLFPLKEDKLSTDYWYTIEGIGTNKFIDVAGGGTADRTNLQLSTKPRSVNNTNQHFKFVRKGYGVYAIHPRAKESSVLDDSSEKGRNEANVHLFSNKNLKNQKFRVVQDKDGNIYFKSLLTDDTYLGWAKTGTRPNLQMVKFTGKGSEKNMQFQLHQWRQVDKSGVPLHFVQDMKTTTKQTGVNPVIKYDVSQIDFVPMKTPSGEKMAAIKLNFEPEAAKDANNFLYAYLKLNGAKIEMSKYISKQRKKGYYLKDLVITITSKDKFENKMDSPANLNSEGRYTESESFSLSANNDGGATADYSWGSSFSRTVKDFNFTNETKGNTAQFHWNLSKVNEGTYENYRSLGITSGGQYDELSDLPAMAKDNFPIDCEVVFRKLYNSNIPNKITMNINIKSIFEKTWLWNDDTNEVESFFNGFGAVFNPKTYDGELLYKFEHSEKTTENNIEVVFDLADLK